MAPTMDATCDHSMWSLLHRHTCNLQVRRGTRADVATWPIDGDMDANRDWLQLWAPLVQTLGHSWAWLTTAGKALSPWICLWMHLR
jgi:hypothetical protein